MGWAVTSSARDQATALSIRNLSKSYSGTRVLGPVDIDFRPGAVHALLGGNGSGKSTLIKTLAGIIPADGGEVTRNGQRLDVSELSSHMARDLGLYFVHQDPGLFPGMTIADNIAADAPYPRRFGQVDKKRLRARAIQAMERLNLDLDPNASIDSISQAQRMMVAIARALREVDSDSMSILVLDEPTASLPRHEVKELLAVLRQLADEGHVVTYVSHHLDEVTEIADECTILRDGVVYRHLARHEIDRPTLVEAIAGRSLEDGDPATSAGIDRAPGLVVRDLRIGSLGPSSFSVGAGELVGLAGLLGSGRSTILRALFGDIRPSGGVIEFDGKPMRFGSTGEAVLAGVAFVPEDRLADGAFLDQEIGDNIIASVASTRRRLFISPREAVRAAKEVIGGYRVRAGSPRALLTRLSGGNQQKVVMARWLRLSPRLLLLDEPTQGVDVGARAEIYEFIRAHADNTGASVLVASSSDEELAQLCDRVLIVSSGQVVGELAGAELTPQTVARAVLSVELQ